MLSCLTSCQAVVTPIAMALAVVAASSQAAGQARQQQADQSQQPRTLELTLPPDRDLLRLRVTIPAEVRINHKFQTQIEVANLSEIVAFHDVKIGQRAGSNVEIESARIDEVSSNLAGEQPTDTAGKQRDESENDDSKNNEDEDGEQSKNEKDSSEQAQNGQTERDKESASQGSTELGNYSHVWTIDRLGPGQTRVIHLTATTTDVGEVQSCLALVSMTPSLCIRTQSIKAELEVVKLGPEQVQLCEPIVYEYSIKNSGTENIERFTLHDELDEGLRTLEGESELRFDVEGLPAGEVRTFNARLVATQAGQYSSRATVKGSNDTEDRSNSVTTRVVGPRLAVAIEGPDTVYVNQPATYTIRVSNQGEGRADAAQLVLRYPKEELTLASMGETRDMIREPTEASVNRDGNEQLVDQDRREQTSLQANGGAQQSANRSATRQTAARDQSTQPVSGEPPELNLGELAPGDSKSVRVTFNTHEGGVVRIEAEALVWCGAGEDAQQVATVTQTQQTELIALPALALSVVDVQDPVRIGEEVTYRIAVRNEGSAADANVRINVELPEELEYIEAGGASEAKSEDQRQIAFEPVQRIAPGQEVVWRVRAKANQPGNIALTAWLESDGLGRQVIAEEPTTLYRPQELNDSEASDTKELDNGNQQTERGQQQDNQQTRDEETASEENASKDDNDSNDRNEDDK